LAERREIDASVDRFKREVPLIIEAELDRVAALMGVDEKRAQVASASYPLSPEQMSAAMETLVRAAISRHQEELLADLKDDGLLVAYASLKLEYATREPESNFLGRALLPSLVSTFEDLLAALVRNGLARFPRALGDLPDVPIDVVFKYERSATTLDLRRWAIDQKVNEFLRKSPEEWRRRLSKWWDVDFGSLGANWIAVNEAIQRRHSVVHNRGLADANYLESVAESHRLGIRLGSELLCDPTYLNNVLTELETFSINIAIHACRKLFAATAFQVYPVVASRIVSLEERGRWAKAAAIAEEALRGEVEAEMQDILRVNRWYCLQEMGLDDATWHQQVDSWSPVDEYGQIGKAALKHNVQRLCELVRSMTGPEGQVRRRELRSAPLMRREMARDVTVRRALLASGSNAPPGPYGPPRRKKGGRR